MKTSPRDQALLTILPAILVLFIYGMAPLVSSWGRALNPHSDIGKLTKQVDDTRKSAPGQQAIAMAAASVAHLNRELAEMRLAKRDLGQQWAGLQRGAGVPPTETALEIEQLFTRHGLVFDKQSVGADSKTQPPERLRKTLQLLQADKGQWLRLQFRGPWHNVRAALDELANCDCAIPVSLTMDEASLNTKERTWTLLVWL